MKWALGIALGLLALIVAVAGVGLLIPDTHRASSRVFIDAPRDSVWAVVRDFASYPEWWPDAESMEPLETEAGREGWLQQAMGSYIPLVVEVDSAPRVIVTRIVDDGLPFGGTWTYELGEASGRTSVTITEDGVIHNPVFRTFARWVFGYHGTMDSYLTALSERFGGGAVPEHVE